MDVEVLSYVRSPYHLVRKAFLLLGFSWTTAVKALPPRSYFFLWFGNSNRAPMCKKLSFFSLIRKWILGDKSRGTIKHSMLGSEFFDKLIVFKNMNPCWLFYKYIKYCSSEDCVMWAFTKWIMQIHVCWLKWQRPRYWPSKVFVICSFFFTWNVGAGKDYVVQPLIV